jgi:hypothetical protein
LKTRAKPKADVLLSSKLVTQFSSVDLFWRVSRDARLLAVLVELLMRDVDREHCNSITKEAWCVLIGD